MELISKHVRWCWKHGVYFVPQAIDSHGMYVKILLIKNGKSKLGEKKYPQITKRDKTALNAVINDLYLAVYSKNIN